MSKKTKITYMHHQAIHTKYIPPTNCRGSRIKVYCQAKSITVPYEYCDDPFDKAALALIEKLGWHGVWVSGASSDGKGNTYVCIKRYK